MTPHEAAAEMRERAARLLEETVETYNEGLSAIDVRLSYTQNLKWPNGHRAAAAIRALPLPDPQPDPRDAALEKAREALTDAWETLDLVVDRLNLPGDELEIIPTIIRAKQALAAIDAALEDPTP